MSDTQRWRVEVLALADELERSVVTADQRANYSQHSQRDREYWNGRADTVQDCSARLRALAARLDAEDA